MSIIKPVNDPTHPTQQKHLVLPAFSFAPTDGLANLIIQAWNEGSSSPVLARDPNTLLPTQGAVDEATRRVNAAGFDLTRAVVITEAEHDNDYVMQSDDEIVFVLPNADRIKQAPTNLLDTAKLLMACTPNGI